jgi:hypothetical protein
VTLIAPPPSSGGVFEWERTYNERDDQTMKHRREQAAAPVAHARRPADGAIGRAEPQGRRLAHRRTTAPVSIVSRCRSIGIDQTS